MKHSGSSVTRLVTPAAPVVRLEVGTRQRPVQSQAATPAKVPAKPPTPAEIEEFARSERERFFRAFGRDGLRWHAEGKTFAECEKLKAADKLWINRGFAGSMRRFAQGIVFQQP